MDEILRLPYINEAEVHDIIAKVYKSAATQVTFKQLQKVNPYRIDSSRDFKKPEKLPEVKNTQKTRWRDKHQDRDEGEHFSYSEDSKSEEEEEEDPFLAKQESLVTLVSRNHYD